MRTSLLAILLIALMVMSADGQSGVKYLSATGTNSTLVRTGRTTLLGGELTNTTSTAYYLKLYDVAAAPVCNTDVPRWTVGIPANQGAQQITAFPFLAGGMQFANGLGFCLTGGFTDTDTTTAATGVIINLLIQ